MRPPQLPRVDGFQDNCVGNRPKPLGRTAIIQWLRLDREIKNSRLLASVPVETPSSYSRQAQRCHRLARAINDPAASARLLELAAEYEAKAKTAD
jgi:hypothetical protein